MGCSSSRNLPDNPSGSTRPRVNYVDELDRSRGLEESRLLSPRQQQRDSPQQVELRRSLPSRIMNRRNVGDRPRAHAASIGPGAGNRDRVLDIASLVRNRQQSQSLSFGSTRSGPMRSPRNAQEADEINQLQSDLDTLERLFQTLLGQSVAAQFAENLQFQMEGDEMMESGCPPASEFAIDNLTCITVSEQDLVEECNRECSICFFPHSVGETDVVRLPCGHIFHKPCIIEWLEKKCTCPLCRFELFTDNEHYELDRAERMGSRKIRIRSNEIDRMSTTDLQQLTNNNTVADHDTLVGILRSSVNIEVYEEQPSPVQEDEDEDENDERKSESESAHDDVNQLDANANANQTSSECMGEGTEDFLMDSKMPATENDIIPNILTVGSATQPIDTIEEAHEEVEEESEPVLLPASASASAPPQDRPVGEGLAP